MLYKLRQRAKDERGFTLIELLVVILIIGILAAIAIPSFLSQTQKANDAGAKELAYTAETTADTYATDHGGSYAGLNNTVLAQYESTINTSGNQGSSAYVQSVTPDSSGLGFTLVVYASSSSSADQYTLVRNDNGTVTRTCTGPGATAVPAGQTQGGCVGGSSGGTW